MSVQNNENTCFKIEDEINEKLVDETLKNTLDFVAFMQENGFSFEYWDNGGQTGWNPVYNGETIGTICICEPTYFLLWLDTVIDIKDSDTVDNDLKEFAWAHVNICPSIHCKPPYCEGISKNSWQIFGKEYDSTCHHSLILHNSDAEAYDNIKKLLLLFKQSRA